jgi:hypothetical protein
MANNNGYKPERLLFYRDGVSEGQFAHCLEQEVPLVQKACMEIDENFRPPITCVPLLVTRARFRRVECCSLTREAVWGATQVRGGAEAAQHALLPGHPCRR